jgi:hypothetical protein
MLFFRAAWILQEFGKNIGWVPGRKNGKPVAVKMVMLIRFSL